MTDTSTSLPGRATAQDPATRLRHELVASLQEEGWVCEPRVAEALAVVPRHRFVPEVDLETAYARTTVSIKDDTAGASLSCASTPAIVAMMLEQAQLAPGQRVLEIGAGSGYNAALLAQLTSPGGQVTTVDVDTELVEHARTHLKNAGYGQVQVRCDDGVAGHAEAGLFDRIMATVGVFDVPPTWLDQLAPTGRLVVPVRLAGDASRSIVFTQAEGYWRGVDAQMCTFMPLRHSSAADPRQVRDVTDDGSVRLQVNQDQDIPTEAVQGVLDEQCSRLWTGVTFGNNESFGELWLWLALALENSLSRMPVTHAAIEEAVVQPMLGWGSMATTASSGGRGLAYLTLRATGDRHELGVIGHGPDSGPLAERMAQEITHWNQHYRTSQASVDLYPRPQTPPPPVLGRFILARPTAHIVLTWRS